jgi:hypothetical protein
MIKFSRVKIKKEKSEPRTRLSPDKESTHPAAAAAEAAAAARKEYARPTMSRAPRRIRTRDYDSDDSSLDIGATANAGNLNITRARGDGVTRSSIIEMSFQIVCAYFTVSFCFIAHAFPTSGPKVSAICTKYMPITWVLAIYKNLDRLLGWLFFSSCPHFPLSPYKVLLGL